MGIFNRPKAKPPEEKVRVTLTFEMDKLTAALFLQSAIERVINESCRLIYEVPEQDVNENYADWNEWKPVVVSMWSAVRDGVYRRKAGMAQKDAPVTLRMGDRYG